MRTPNEIVHEDADSIEFTMFDDVMNKTARKIFDRSLLLSLDPFNREMSRQKINRDLNEVLDREARKLNESKKFNLDDKIMTEEEWRALVPHESEAEVPPVPTYKQIIEWAYDADLRERS